MEHHQYQQQQQHEESNPSGVVGGSVGGSKSSFLCRQSSTRWIPTADQIRILRDLYYNRGIRSPTADQIQKISATLRKYGKIEGKNVFYWFQNHKARERQKKRLTVDISTTTTTTPSNSTIPTMSPGLPTSCSSPGLYGVGHMGSSGCGGSVLLERSFRECCMPGGGGGDGSGMESSMGWMGLESHATPWMYCYPPEHEEGAVMVTREIETLPLFPIKQQEEGEEAEKKGEFITHSHLNHCSNTNNNNGNNQCFPAFYWGGGQQDQHHLYTNRHHNGSTGGAAHQAASLDLTLNSYYYAPPGST